nr:cytochrome c3 family protein [Kofleriaceae bacterium]
MWKLVAIALAIVALGAMTLGACQQTRVAQVDEPHHDPSRLDHAQHRAVACTDCHRSDARPGSDDHAPCDRCHAKAFAEAPGPLCLVCHTQITAAPMTAPTKKYPVEDAWQSEPTAFSHQLHLDAGRMERAVGFHVQCADCHVGGDGALARPDHATCARCHAPEARLVRAPAMTACTGCHAAGSRPRARGRLIRGDLAFDHATHVRDLQNQPIRCEVCHAQSAAARGYDDHPPPRIQACVACHDDSDRAPRGVRMRECEVCHKARSSSLAVLAPRDHLPLTEKPEDHTLAFRRDHGEAASHDSARCARCHTQMSGNPERACDDCHQTMQPADHRVTWREYDHGPEALADRTRCATCHVAELCTACHSQRPRSHGAIGSFASDHGPLARIDVQPCLTCHVQPFCDTCHRTRSR